MQVVPSLTLEQGFGKGAQIGAFHNPMISKLVVHRCDRVEALRCSIRARTICRGPALEVLHTLVGNAAFVSG